MSKKRVSKSYDDFENFTYYKEAFPETDKGASMSLEYDFGPVPKPKDKYDDFESFTYYKEELLEIARDLIKERKELLERERVMMLRVNDLEYELAKLRYRFRYELP